MGVIISHLMDGGRPTQSFIFMALTLSLVMMEDEEA